MRWRAYLIITIVLIAALAFGKGKKVAEDVRTYRSVVPLGIMKFTSNNEVRPMYLLVTAENPAFANWHTSEAHRMPVKADGTPVKFFPSRLNFRVTATARTSELVGIDEYPLNIPPGSLNDFMTKLRFRLCIFHGLDKHTLQPDTVQEIGMPDDVSYDERVFRVAFTVGDHLPVEDRIVLEVLSPDGDRLGKFHLEF